VIKQARTKQHRQSRLCQLAINVGPQIIDVICRLLQLSHGLHVLGVNLIEHCLMLLAHRAEDIVMCEQRLLVFCLQEYFGS
jgi:hypothetical protein